MSKTRRQEIEIGMIRRWRPSLNFPCLNVCGDDDLGRRNNDAATIFRKVEKNGEFVGTLNKRCVAMSYEKRMRLRKCDHRSPHNFNATVHAMEKFKNKTTMAIKM